MEWSGQQQIQFLLQSVILGVLQGAILDMVTALVHHSRRGRWLWTDVAFGPLAAVVTFLGSLVIMDGQLHPLLFVGIGLGMVLEHLTIGSILGRCIRWARRQINRGVICVCRSGRMVVTFLRCARKKRKNDEKPRILQGIFSKNT